METLTIQEPITAERISYLINQKGIDPIVAGIDLEMVKMKLRDPEEGLGWTYDECDEAEVEYKRYLHLTRKFPEASLVPHSIMDDMWHQHILDTRAYHKDSDLLFGEYLHHYPYFGLRSEKDKQNLISSFEETQSIYESEFGEKMIKDEAVHCKRACPSYCKRACKS
ncbi:MAG: hypothetical protein M0D57_02920 [Sphingobacteriales bacterium JAD_PAG50586_3]|nr:MAG: hypothetical protein M0D57_02920 [Sphingobacteriales bacterium JAD_PAG50586_3]